MSLEITYDLRAKISLLPTEMGGRKKPVANGYKPSFAFNSSQHFSGEIRLVRKKILNPGDSAVAVIKLLPARNLRKNLKPNDAFTITEGNKTVGSGIIEKVTVIE
jgi:translation elongation factor EF-Tu-like GTPase